MKNYFILIFFVLFFGNSGFSQNNFSKKKIGIVDLDSVANVLLKDFDADIQLQKDSMIVLGNALVRVFQNELEKAHRRKDSCLSPAELKKMEQKLRRQQNELLLLESAITDSIPQIREDLFSQIKKIIIENVNDIIPDFSYKLIIDQNQLLYYDSELVITDKVLKNRHQLLTHLDPILNSKRIELKQLYTLFKND